MANVVIPMAGAGSRFVAAGYTKPKPLLKVDGLAMVQKAVWGCNIGGRTIYIVQKEHSEKYNLKELLPTFTTDLEVVVVEVDGLTEGAAASVLAAKEYIDNDDILVICDSDTIIDWDPNKFLVEVGEERHLDGAIATFNADGDRWSYVLLNEKNLVARVAEKNQISEKACAGVYYWRYGSDFVAYAEKMIERNKRVNGEFYVAPVYNEAISDGRSIGIYDVNSVICLGTPEDYEKYIDANANQT